MKSFKKLLFRLDNLLRSKRNQSRTKFIKVLWPIKINSAKDRMFMMES
jgi:hypothetical protein